MSVIIRLQNLPMSANASNIRRFFSGLSIPEGGVHIVGGNEGDAFIAFSTDEDARKAMLLDRQSINNATVRLMLSSKTEMQSVISTARSSVMYNTTQSNTTQSSVPERNEAMQALDVTANTLPSSFSSYRNGSDNSNIHDSAFEDSSDPFIKTNPDSLSVNDPHNDMRFPNQNRFNEIQQPPHLSRRPEANYPIHNHSAPYSNTQHSQQPNFQNPPRFADPARDPRSAPVQITPESDFKPSPNVPEHQANINYPRVPFEINRSVSESAPERQTKSVSYNQSWSNKTSTLDHTKRPLDNSVDQSDRNNKRRLMDQSKNVVRMTLPLQDIGVKSVFDVLRGAHIMSKWGIVIEEDNLQRPTGYVYVMFSDDESFDRSISYNGRLYKGTHVNIEPTTVDTFFCAADPSTVHRFPADYAKKLRPNVSDAPPHFNDCCIEVSEIPSDATPNEIVRFLGVPGLNDEDVRLSGFGNNENRKPKTPNSIRALVRVHSSEDIKILMSANFCPLRPDAGLPPIRLTPISLIQMNEYGRNPLPQDHQASDSTPITCGHLKGFSFSMRECDVLKCFPSILIPGNAVHMIGPTRTEALIDFVSEKNCQKAIAEIANPKSTIRQSHVSIRIDAITPSDMNTRLTELGKFVPPRENRPSLNRDHHEPVPPNPGNGIRSQQYPNRSHVAGNDRKSTDIPARPIENQQRNDPTKFNESLSRPSPPIPQQQLAGPPNPHQHPPPHYNHNIRHEQPPPGMRPHPEVVSIYIGNMLPGTSIDQVACLLKEYPFIPGSIRIRRDPQGQTTGEALVDFRSSYDADRMLREMKDFRMSGRNIVVHPHRL